MNKIEQYIINACSKNDPSIMELTMGCRVVYGSDEYEPIQITIGSPYFVKENRVINPFCSDDQSFLLKIIGRDILAQDIVYASKKILLDSNGIFYDVSTLKPLNLGHAWQKGTLHEQEEETKLLLARLLGFKE